MGPSASEASRLLSDRSARLGGGMSVHKSALMISGAMAGTGVLALPSAGEVIGIAGPILLAGVAALCCYTGVLLGRSWTILEHRYKLDSHTQDPYPLLAEKTMGKIGRFLVKFCIYVFPIGTGAVYLLLSSDIVSDLIKTLGNHEFSFCYVALIISCSLVPISWLGTPKDFWLLGVLAIVSTLCAGVVITSYTAYLMFERSELLNFNEVSHQQLESEKFFMAIGTIVFALASHPLFPTVQQDMKEKSKFDRALGIAYALATSLYLVVMVTTDYLLGDRIGSNILTTLTSIQSGWPIYLTEIFILTHFITGYLVNINPVNQDFEEIFNVLNEFSLGRVLIRTLVVAFILFVSETIPRFEVLLALVGGSTMTATAFIFPIIMYEILTRQYVTSDKTYIPKYIVTAFHVIIVAFGLIVMISSTYFALVDILGPNTFIPPCYVNVTFARV